MKEMRLFCFGVLGIGLAVFLIRGTAIGTQDRQFQPVGFTLVQIEKVAPPGGELIRQGVWTRVSNSKGEWKQTIQKYKNNELMSTNETVGTERGVFKVIRKGDQDTGKLGLLSAWMSPQPIWYTDKYYRSLPDFNREETILGYRAYVTRKENRDLGVWEETTYIPQLGPIGVKMVTFGPLSGTTIIEPVSIVLQEPDPGSIKLPDLPVSYDLIQEKVDNLDSKGRHDAASFWREQMKTNPKKDN